MTALEIRFSHHDIFLQKLNEIVIEQPKKIELLERAMLDLNRLAGAQDGVTLIQGMKDDTPLTTSGLVVF
jgi:uncharacterized coiled-coil protein SlyX